MSLIRFITNQPPLKFKIMKTYEKINMALDELNMVDEFNQIEMEIMLECDEYNDSIAYSDLARYESLTSLEE